VSATFPVRTGSEAVSMSMSWHRQRQSGIGKSQWVRQNKKPPVWHISQIWEDWAKDNLTCIMSNAPHCS
jgi:hypothetical protein